MSPEQACGRDVDGRSDVYGLGCAMYHLMTGKLPFPGTSPIERLGKRISGRHVPITEHLPDLPSNVVRVLDKMMAHKPHERFAGAAELAEALGNLVRPRPRSPGKESRPSTAPVAGPAPRAGSVDAVGTEQAPAPMALAAPPKVVKVQPRYPAWFAPMARLAESRPGGALALVLLTISLVFGSGLLLGLVLK
jgi:serine/threonine-protein kinase